MKGNKIIILMSLFFLLYSTFIWGQQGRNVIPQPQFIRMTHGFFTISSATVVVASGNLLSQALQFNKYLEPALGFRLAINSKAVKRNSIEFKIDKTLDSLGNEGYQLEVNTGKIILKALNEKGIFWGIQTLRQLLPEQILRDAIVKNISWEIPCTKIEDKPRFQWRGLMLDCSRTFITKEQIKKYLEAMSFFKMNILHMHLTDDQGWRLEIKKYPELTSICSKFDTSFHENKDYQGYYSQDDIKELIEFAAQRNIQIVPEIEMPGHTTEVFAAFPQLSCKGNIHNIQPWFKSYGITSEVFCAGNEETFTFLENVLNEVATLFPSTYIHIGGDEAPKLHWKECPKCQKRIKDEGLKDENELQSWFVKRIEKYVNSKGKKLIGWDEIMEGGLSATATMMYWRGWQKDILKKIPTLPNNVIMTPTTYAYFDSPYENTSTKKVYDANPAINEMVTNKNILGVQANFWSHLARTAPQIDRQLFPRLLALSEIAWTDNHKKNWNGFKARLISKLKSLDIMGVYYFIENQ